MTCPHQNINAPCWRCDGLDNCEWLVAMRALTNWPKYDNTRNSIDHYNLPPDCFAVRNQDVPLSACAGDHYVSTRGKVWLLCARGPNWSIVQRVESLPLEAVERARALVSGSARHSKLDGAFGRAKEAKEA